MANLGASVQGNIVQSYDQRQTTIPYEQVIEVDAPPTVYYRKRGWCTTDLVFEHWITTDPDAANPNGHSHTDVTIVARWETGK